MLYQNIMGPGCILGLLIQFYSVACIQVQFFITQWLFWFSAKEKKPKNLNLYESTKPKIEKENKN